MTVPLSFGFLTLRRSDPRGMGRQGEMAAESTVQSLLAARGALFDGLAALANLQQLLGSVRVGPRQLQDLLPETAARCGLLALAAGEFGDAARLLAGPRASLDALDHLADFCRSTLGQVAVELQNATRDLRANTRLDLEARLGRRTQSLTAAFSLVDVMADALVQKATTLELLELLQQASRQGDLERHGTVACTVHVTSPAQPLLVHTNARVASTLLALAASWLYRRTSANPSLLAEVCHYERTTTLRFSPNKPLRRGPGQVILIPNIPWVRITPMCMRLAAELSGADLLDSEDPPGLALRWPWSDSC